MRNAMNLSFEKATLLQTLTGHTSDVTSCDFTPNFTIVTGSSDKSVRLWDWNPGIGYKERSNSPLLGHKYGVTCVRVSPQGCMLASTSIDGTAVLWNLHSGGKIYTMAQVNGDSIRVCRFSPDSSILATAGDNGAICIWDLIHRSLIRTILEHEGATQSLGFTPDSRYLISACSLEVMNIWDIQDLGDASLDGGCLPVASIDNAHDLGVFCIDVSSIIITDNDNPLIKYYTLATCGNGNVIKIWTVTSHMKSKFSNEKTSNDVQISLEDQYDGHCSAVTSVKYNSSGTYLISSSLDKLVKIWDNTGSCLCTLEGHNRYVNCVTFSRDSRLAVSGSNDKLLIVWDLMGNLTLDSEFTKPHMQNYSTSTHLESIKEQDFVRNAETGNSEVTLLEKLDDIAEGAINSCCFSQNILAIGSGDKLVKIFKVTEENNNTEELPCSPLEGHTYAVHHVEFSRDGAMLASCSLDGSTIIWDPATGAKIQSLPKNSLGIKVCRFSPEGTLLVTAGDDEKACVWNLLTMKEITSLEGHLDAVTSACFSPDGEILVTTSSNAQYLLWVVNTYNKIHTQEDAHDLGIQSCDFSPNVDPVPNTDLNDAQSYLLATCGNDSLVKLWKIMLPKKRGKPVYEDVDVKVWRCLRGHGGNVICVRFSPSVGEIVCSTATDRQARLWSVYGAECLFVLDHDSIVTSCSFNTDCSLLATGCIDKTVYLWKLPLQFVFQTAVANKIKCRTKSIIDWTVTDIVKWLKNIDFETIVQNVLNTSLNGQKLLTLTEEQICSGLDLGEKDTQRLIKEIKWLKQDEVQFRPFLTDSDIPHEFLCPITHEIMREPVTCNDGFTYEKKAIVEWFMSGKCTSPMTNDTLINTDYKHNHELRNKIHHFLYDDE